MLTVTGYVTGEPEIKQTEYGSVCNLSVRWKTSNGKQTHFATAAVYGKRMKAVTDFIHDGDQVTISGSIKSIVYKQRDDDRSYCQIYMDCAEFSLPSKPGAGGNDSTRSASRQAPSDEEIPF